MMNLIRVRLEAGGTDRQKVESLSELQPGDCGWILELSCGTALNPPARNLATAPKLRFEVDPYAYLSQGDDAKKYYLALVISGGDLSQLGLSRKEEGCDVSYLWIPAFVQLAHRFHFHHRLPLREVSATLRPLLTENPSLLPHWLEAIKTVLRTEPTRVWSLADLSVVGGVSTVTISKSFPRYVRMNFQDYLKVLRLNHTIQLIACTQLRLTDIAYLSAFADQSHFGRSFKEWVGTTPKDITQMMRTKRGRTARSARVFQ